ncbi:MAG: hypothetical protein NVSMB30_09710 [Hymenobacter sp.]
MSSEAKNLTAATVNGVKWTMSATVFNSVLQVGYTAVMARLLDPAAFGLVALAGIVLRFGSYFARMGMEQAIVQKPDLTERDVRAAFTSALLLGGFFAGLLVLAAPLAARALGQPAVEPVVRALALSLLLTGLSATAQSLLRRAMRFRTLALIEMTTFAVSYVGLGLVLAWQGFGVWSLVGATLGQGLLLTVLVYAALPHPARLLFSWTAYRPLLAYGSRMSGISFVEFLVDSLDTFMIGRLLGPSALGIYSRGTMLIGLPVYLLTTSVAKVMFPSFSQVQADRSRLRAVYLSSITLVGTLVMPICAGVAVAAPEVVAVLLGPKWQAAVPVLRVVCGVYMLSMVTMFAGVVCDATAALSGKLVVSVSQLVVLAGLMLVLSRYGLVGVAWALVLGEVVRMGIYMKVMQQVLAVRPGAVLRAYGPGVLGAVTVAGAIGGARAGAIALSAPALLVLVVEMGTGALVLAALVLGRPPLVLREVLGSVLVRLTGVANAAPEGGIGQAQQVLLSRLARITSHAPVEDTVAPPRPSTSPRPLAAEAAPALAASPGREPLLQLNS